jgi:hypothetical protein
VIGMSSAAEAMSTPSSDVWITRKGEAPKCRSQARKGAHDKGHITEEPCARKPARTVLKQRRGSDPLVDCNPTAPMVALWHAGVVQGAAAHRQRSA